VSVEYSAFVAAVGSLRARVQAATVDGVEQGADVVKRQIQDNLSRREYPPTSPPGEPPALRSGFLRDEVYTSTASTGVGATAEIWPSTVYARIHELSGWAGRDHRSFLPRRPYVEPALEESADRFDQIMTQAWSEAIGG